MTREIEESKLNKIPQNKSTQVLLNCWIAVSDNRLDLYSLFSVPTANGINITANEKNLVFLSFFFLAS